MVLMCRDHPQVQSPTNQQRVKTRASPKRTKQHTHCVLEYNISFGYRSNSLRSSLDEDADVFRNDSDLSTPWYPSSSSAASSRQGLRQHEHTHVLHK
eukprot:1865103-Amphidinium_carterae.1